MAPAYVPDVDLDTLMRDFTLDLPPVTFVG